MEKKTIQFSVERDKIFQLYIGVMNPFLKLSNREAEVVSRLLHLNYKYKSYSEPVKWKMVFDKESRKEMYESMEISVHQYNNILTSLRKKNIILPGNILTKKLLIYPDDGLSINFKMSVVNETIQEAH